MASDPTDLERRRDAWLRTAGIQQAHANRLRKAAGEWERKAQASIDEATALGPVVLMDPTPLGEALSDLADQMEPEPQFRLVGRRDDGVPILEMRNVSADLEPGPAGGRIVSVDGEPVDQADPSLEAKTRWYDHGADHDDFVNDILANTPDCWDGDAAAEDIAVRYVRFLETQVIAEGVGLCECSHGTHDNPLPGLPR